MVIERWINMNPQQLKVDVDKVTLEINRCNQRGGRMLSLVDLIHAETISIDLAAYLSAHIYKGASFLVGAVPGGGGKTTVMGAFLACLPPGCLLIPTDDSNALFHPPTPKPDAPLCYVCHEIGSGPYYAYLWGEEAKVFFALPKAGHQIATNLHADTYEQCRYQLCEENGVPIDSFESVRFLVFLGVGRKGFSARRWIETVWESDKKRPHQLIYQSGDSRHNLEMDEKIVRAKETLDSLCRRNRKTIEEFRLGWLESHLG